ncbi:anti-sigma factor [Paenibacillus piscarius]|uniref:anti-sigma factor n=1 Tax=Paenibacillus piscarius TaxID=1089681 RepID=UPI001EE83413|nr:anti-sigma factor [Paenibacillus piscarius]
MTAPWKEAEDQNIIQTLKKTKRKSLIRSILISVTVSVLVLIAVFIGAAQLVDRMSSKALFSEEQYMRISSPNEYGSGYKDNRGFLSGVLEMQTYKIIGDVPIPWKNRWLNYNAWWFPFTTGAYGGTGNLTVEDPRMKQEEYEYYRGYNSYNGQREMAFYVPGVDYNGKILNDLSELNQMNGDKRVELAVSLDKDYSFEEAKNLLPAGVKPVWYWVDTYDDREGFQFKPYPNENDPANKNYPLPMSANFGVYGFGIRPDWDQASPEDFIGSVTIGLDKKDKYHGEYQRIYNYLRKDKAAPGAGDVRILGVVVTGTADGLKSLQGKAYVRAAVLGAVANKY